MPTDNVRVSIRLSPVKAEAVRKACDPVGISTLTGGVQYLLMLGLQHAQASAAAMRIAQDNSEMARILKEQARYNDMMAAALQGEMVLKGKKSLGDGGSSIIFNTMCNNADAKEGEKEG